MSFYHAVKNNFFFFWGGGLCATITASPDPSCHFTCFGHICFIHRKNIVSIFFSVLSLTKYSKYAFNFYRNFPLSLLLKTWFQDSSQIKRTGNIFKSWMVFYWKLDVQSWTFWMWTEKFLNLIYKEISKIRQKLHCFCKFFSMNPLYDLRILGQIYHFIILFY